MTKEFRVCNCQPVLIPLRYACDDGDCSRIWMKMKRKIDRFPHADRADYACDAWPHLLHLGAANIGKDDWHPRKHLVTVLHRELKHRIARYNHDVQLDPT